MQIGTSLFLLAVGAILSFAVQDRISGVDLTMVGYILIAVGALGLVLSLILGTRTRRDVPPPR
ncbi:MULTISPECIES: DUF6458 family protein [unclassified Aeromicrobium]|jgi:uncharacterized YccA/Bax inhibitor family protein|uniref:DUF6458 family protein n=1 Tax=unclassified Aeromicrobium TaxID=2633570 RepID=UPI002096CCC7|nr:MULTISPECIES: DUF6458 family protein [unclassified Aeromicrobium]MCO7238922.1 DUF6458 family protein [Aeromicrobium sp. CnD17-E]MDR6119648.1 putative YccA/Bax inhibitor family protein [Aeromicrobium sp. SORGH_AS_0981]